MNIKGIHINPNNPRYIKDERYQKLKKSIQEFPKMMKLRPIIIDDEGMILGGNMRYLAMVDLGYKEIPEGWIIKASELTEEERKRFIIADNVEFGAFDYDKLANEWDLEELQEWGIELPELEVENIELNEKDDEIPEPPKEPKSKLGDLYQLDNHRLLCGDATKKEDVERLMDGKKADMVFTDPPYGINLDTDWSGMRGSRKIREKVRHDLTGHKYNPVIGDDKLFNFNNVIIPNCEEQFWFGADYYHHQLPEGGSWLIWDKRLTEDMDRVLGSPFEMIWSKAKHRKEIIRIIWAGVSGFQEDVKRRIHPTQKPLKLLTWVINKYGKILITIIDLFGGSGSTLIACEKLNRICYMMEIDPIYIDVIIERWGNYTGKKAVKIK